MSGYRRSFPEGTSERVCALMSEARNISELKRAQCIYFRSEHGLPPQQIADMVGFDVGTVRNLHSAFLRDGEAALKLSGKGGRYHAYLTEEEEASWLEGFRDAGENGGILEVGRIQAAFEEIGYPLRSRCDKILGWPRKRRRPSAGSTIHAR